jgi:hypothetical protein
MDNVEVVLVNNNILEIHYWLEENSHLMDASVENKCNYEVLGIINEIAKLVSINVIIETEPLGEGGLRKMVANNF